MKTKELIKLLIKKEVLERYISEAVESTLEMQRDGDRSKDTEEAHAFVAKTLSIELSTVLVEIAKIKRY